MSELKAAMTYAEFVRHIAYYRLFPWGDDWAQAGVQAWAAVQPHVKRRMRPEDFKPKPPRRQQSPDYIFGVVKQLAIDAEARRKAKSGGTEHQ